MLLTGELAGLRFKYANIINFQIIRFAIIETKNTLLENIVGWVKTDKDNSWYTHLCIIALILKLQYIILSIGKPERNIYNFTIVKIIYSVFIFGLQDMKYSNKKYKLMYYLDQKLLFLEDLILCLYVYRDNEKDCKVIKVPKILEKKKAKSLFIISSL